MIRTLLICFVLAAQAFALTASLITWAGPRDQSTRASRLELRRTGGTGGFTLGATGEQTYNQATCQTGTCVSGPGGHSYVCNAQGYTYPTGSIPYDTTTTITCSGFTKYPFLGCAGTPTQDPGPCCNGTCTWIQYTDP